MKFAVMCSDQKLLEGKLSTMLSSLLIISDPRSWNYHTK